MKWNELILQCKAKLPLKTLERYKWIIVVMLVGAFLLAIPSHSGNEAKDKTDANLHEVGFNLEETEKKFSKALSEVEGAGEVTVVLSVKTGVRQKLAQDSTVTEKASGMEESTKTVILSKGSGTEDTVTLQEIYPQFQGALVISDGGNQPAVRLKLMQATSALTGLGADKISICNRGK